MSETRSQWLLKVIAGPHQGAEIELATGKSLIGSDEGCDVVLHDVLIAPQHMAIDAGPKALFVEPLGGRVYLAGKRVKDTRQKVEPFIFITLGGTHLVIGPVDGKWPLLSAGDAPELEKEAPEPAPDAEAKAGEGAPEGAAARTPASGGTPAQGDGDTPPPPKRAVAVFGVAFGLILLTAWLILFNIWKGNNPLPGSDGEADLKSRAEEVLKVHGASESVRVESEGGRLYARGYVGKTDQLRDIEVDLRTRAVGVVPRIWSLESLAESARSVLRIQRLPLDVTATGEGRLQVTGTVSDRDLWNRVKQQLTTEIPGVTGIDTQVTVPAIMKPSDRTVIVTLPANAAPERPEGADPSAAMTPTAGPTTATGTASNFGPAPTAGPASNSGSALGTVSASGSSEPRPRTESRAERDTGTRGGIDLGTESRDGGPMGSSSGVNVSGSAFANVTAPAPPPRALFPTIDKYDATVESIQNRPGGLGSMRLSSGGIYFAGARLPFGGVVKQVTEGRVIIKEGEGERTVGIGDMVRLGATSGATMKGVEVNIAAVSDALRDSVGLASATVEPVSVRRALPANEPAPAPAAKPGQASALVAAGTSRVIEPPLPTAEPPLEAGEPSASTQAKPASAASPADFQKPGQPDRQKAKQEALEAAVAASETAKPAQPAHNAQASTAVSVRKESKP